jgi:hypothetical protein
METIENETFSQDSDIANIYANANIVLYMLNHKRFEIATVEEKYGIKLNFLIDPDATSDSFSIEKIALPTHEGSYSVEVPEQPQVKKEQSYNTPEPQVKKEESYNTSESETSEAKQSHQPSSKRRKWKDSNFFLRRTLSVKAIMTDVKC